MVRYDPSRRIWLRNTGLLGWAAAWSLIAGCDAQSPTVPKVAAPPAEPPPATRPDRAAEPAVEPGKISKAAAEYRDQPKGEQHCSNCVLFQADTRTCRLVSGQVSPNGWCKYWAIRPAS